MDDLSILVVGDGRHGDEVRDLIQEWTASGLLRDSLWVRPSSVSESLSGPPTIRAIRVSHEGQEELDLFEALGVRHLSLVRLAVVHLLPLGTECEPALAELGARLAALVQTVLPRGASEDGEEGANLQRINVVVPGSGAEGLPSTILQPGWEVNAVVSSEDRPDLDRASIFVREPGNFAGHAAGAAASVAGLWLGVRAGCLDDEENDSTTGDHDLIVIRPSVRAIVGSERPRDLAGAAMDMVLGEATGPARLVPWANPARDIESAIRRTFQWITARGDWSSPAETDVTDPLQLELAPRESFAVAARFNLRLFHVGAGWALGLGRRAVENVATGLTVGRDSDYVVRIEPRSPEALAIAAQTRLERQASSLRHEVLKKEADTIAALQPSTWADLRRASFALVDGSEPPEGLEVPFSMGKRELLPPSAIAPDPQEDFSAGGTTLRPCDPAAASTLRERLIAAAKGAAEGADEAPALAKRRAEATEDLARLERWTARRSGSLLWRLADDVHHRAESAEKRANENYRDFVSGTPPTIDKVRTAQTLLIRWWTALLATWVALTLYAGWRFVTDQAGLDWTLSFTAATLGLAFAAIALANHGFFRAVRRHERAVQLLLAQRRRGAEAYVASRRESQRLTAIYTFLLDWAEIIAWVTHRPWAPQRQENESLSDEGLAGLPAAVAVARSRESSADLPVRNVTAAVSELCSPGWSARLFSDLAAMHEDEADIEDVRGYLSADLDTADSPQSPRRQLLVLMKDGHGQRHLTERAHQAIRAAVSDGRVDLPLRRVHRLGRFRDNTEHQDTEFFAAMSRAAIPFVDDIWTADGLHRRRHLPKSVRVWLPHGVQAPRGGLTVLESHGDIAVRVDVSPVCAPGDLTLFAVGGHDAVPGSKNHSLEIEGAWY
jgi:hypothetical protein